MVKRKNIKTNILLIIVFFVAEIFSVIESIEIFLLFDESLILQIALSGVLLLAPIAFLIINVKNSFRTGILRAANIFIVLMYCVAFVLSVCIPFDFFRTNKQYADKYPGEISFFEKTANEEGMEQYIPVIDSAEEVQIFKHASNSGYQGYYESIFIKWSPDTDKYFALKQELEYIGTKKTVGSVTIHHFYNGCWEILYLFEDDDYSVSWAAFRNENTPDIAEIDKILSIYYDES